MTTSFGVSFIVCMDTAVEMGGEYTEVTKGFSASAGGIEGVCFDTSLADGSCVLREIDFGDEVLSKVNNGTLEFYVGSNTGI